MMHINDFPRPPDDNGRGLHWSARVYHPTNEPTRGTNNAEEEARYAMSARIYREPAAAATLSAGEPPTVNWTAAPHEASAGELDYWINELQAMHIKWVKLMDDGGGSSLLICQRLLQAGIMPIVRLFKERPNPAGIGGREFETVSRLVDVGVRYFETNNEPDLPAEWENNLMPPNWLDIVVDNFIRDADQILGRGGLPALPAMGPGSRDNPIARVLARGRRDLFERGAWIAIHNYTLNHPLDYPDDAVNQLGAPLSQAEYDRYGAWSWDHRVRESENPEDETINRLRRERKRTGITIFDDPNCFRGYEAAGKMIFETLGFYVPVISTEGGPVVGWGDDRRYNKIIPSQQMEMQTEIVRQMQNNETPDWYFALCTWLIASRPLGDFTPAWETMSWYTHWWDQQFGLDGRLPIVDALKALPSVARVWPAGTPQTARLQGSLWLNNGQAPGAVRLRLQAAGHAPILLTTAPGGAFDADGLAAAAYSLSVADGPEIAGAIALSVGEQRMLNVSLPDAGRAGVSTLTGQVLRNDRPQPGEEVKLLALSSGAAQVIASQTVLGQGRFHFGGLGPGVYQAQSGNTTSAVVTLDGWSSAAANLALPAPPDFRYRVTSTQATPGSPRRIIGRVFDTQGNGLNGIKVQMSWPNPEPDTQFPETLTGRDPFKPQGFYEFLASAGQFQVKIIQGDWESDASAALSTVAVPGQPGDSFYWEVNFQLQQVARKQSAVRGRITNPPAAGVIVLSSSALTSGPLRQALPASGEFEFRDLPAGSDYELALERVARLGAAFALDGANTVERSMALTAALAGRVLGLTAGALVGLARLSPLAWRRAVTAAADGAYRFDSLPPGRYQVSAGDKQSADIVLAEGQSAQVPTLDLTPPPPPPPPTRSIIRGLVQYVSGGLLAGAAVELHRDGLLETQTLSDSEGEFDFSGLAAGVYSVHLPEYWESSTLTLDGSAEITVTLSVPDPEPPPAALSLRQFLLLGRVAGARAAFVQDQLRLLAPFLALHPDVAVGFDPAPAAKAERVTILGDATLVSYAIEQELRLAGGRVERVEGDLYALADWLKVNL